jgi:DNA-binding IclR family transcriptional regulator
MATDHQDGLDSMPAGRLRAFEFLLAREAHGDTETTTTDVATELGLPNPTTHRTLSDLAAHSVVVRESQGQGKPDLWRVEPWATERYSAATTSSEKSDTPI